VPLPVREGEAIEDKVKPRWAPGHKVSPRAAVSIIPCSWASLYWIHRSSPPLTLANEQDPSPSEWMLNLPSRKIKHTFSRMKIKVDGDLGSIDQYTREQCPTMPGFKEHWGGLYMDKASEKVTLSGPAP
jgi:hypothetical protein